MLGSSNRAHLNTRFNFIHMLSTGHPDQQYLFSAEIRFPVAYKKPNPLDQPAKAINRLAFNEGPRPVIGRHCELFVHVSKVLELYGVVISVTNEATPLEWWTTT